MTSSTPWQERLSAGTEPVQDDVVRWYQDTRAGKAYVPTMIWGTLQTEAYATVILGQVVDFLGAPDDVPAGVAKRMQRQRVLHDGDRAHVELVSSSVDITEPGELALYRKAFTTLSSAAAYDDKAARLLRKAHAFWTAAPPQG